MASFDVLALATAIGLQTERVRLRIGPLTIGVRSPVAIALGVASVATLIGRRLQRGRHPVSDQPSEFLELGSIQVRDRPVGHFGGVPIDDIEAVS